MLNNHSIDLFIIESAARNIQYGIGTYINELTKALLLWPNIKIYLVSVKSNSNNEFSVLTITERFIKIIIPAPQFSIEKIDTYEKKYASVVVKLLSEFVPKNGNVIFQLNNFKDLDIAVKLKEYFNYPLVSTVHAAVWQMLFEGNIKKFRNIDCSTPSNSFELITSQEKEFYRLSDHIVSVTKYMKDFLIKEYSINCKKITTIHNGIDSIDIITISTNGKAELKAKLGFQKKDIIILFLGRLDSCKGIFFLLKAFEEACKHNFNLKLVVLGSGSIETCQKKINSFYGKVTFPGFLPKDKVKSFYLISDIGVVPSIYDHCPFSVLEMMANRIPLIVSKIRGLDEILPNDGCLFLNPVISSDGSISLNIKELSRAMQTLAGDEELRISLSTKSYKHFKNEFTSNLMAEKMYNLFNSLIIN